MKQKLMFILYATTLVIATILSGCEFMYGDHDPINFGLSLSFQDASGKDLVEGIGCDSLSGEMESELYTLRIFEDGKKQYPRGVHGEDFSAIKYLNYIPPSYYTPDPYGRLPLSCSGNEYKKTFTAFLACPYIFDDDTEHEITSYWKKKGGSYTCNRLTFDGKKIDIVKQEHGQNFATITVN